MTEKEKQQEENKRIFEIYRDEINKRDLSNSESFDKALLSLSSAGLALSLTFIKFIVPLEEIKSINYLYSIWILFGLTIILIIISILVSQKALKNSLLYAEKYYLENEEEYFNKKDNWNKLNSILPFLQSTTFILAIICVIIFATINFEKSKDKNMSEKKSQIVIEAGMESLVPTMQKKTETRGATIPKIQKIPTPKPDSNSNTSSEKKE